MLEVVHIEKCGGTTLIHALRRHFGLAHFDVIPRGKNSMLFTHEDLRSLLRLRPTVKSIAGHPVRVHSNLHELLADSRYVTILRDPVARYVSRISFANCWKGGTSRLLFMPQQTQSP